MMNLLYLLGVVAEVVSVVVVDDCSGDSPKLCLVTVEDLSCHDLHDTDHNDNL